MEDDGFLPIRGKQPSSFNGSRSTLGLFPDRLRRPANPLDAVTTRQSSPVLDRFRLLLRERDEELSGIDGEEPPPLTTEEVVRLYEDVLSELTVNSKPIITELTIIAGEQRDHAEGIADAICSRILEVPLEHKLPSLYLLDSIVKNIGCEYVRYFAARLPEVFCEAYTQVPSNLNPAMHHLFRTWSSVFPPVVLGKIENQLQFTSAENKKPSGAGSTRQIESPSRPAHGIHVNPKYLEARRQFEHADVDAQHTRKRLPSFDAFEQTSLSKYKDYDLDLSDVMLAPVSARSNTLHVHTSAITENGKAISFERKDLRRSSSPEIGLERGSHNKVWQEKNISHHVVKRQDEIHSTYEPPIEFSSNRPRALIEAYGNSKSNSIHPEMPSKFRKLHDDGVGTDTAVRKWENSEEEEYRWDDMSPTLSDRGKSMKLTKYDLHQGRYGMETRLRKPDASILDSNFKTSSWLMPQPLAAEHSGIHEEREAMSSLGRRPRNDQRHVPAEKSETLRCHGVYSGRDLWMPDYLQSSKIPALSSGPSTINQRFQPFPHPSDRDASMQWLPNIQSDSVAAATMHPLPASDKKHLIQRGDFPPIHSMDLFKSQPPLPSLSVPLKPFESANQLNSLGPDKLMQRHGISVSFSSSTFLSDDTHRDSMDSRTLMSAPGESMGLYPLTQHCHGSLPPQFQPCVARGSNLPSATLQVSAQVVVQPPDQLREHVQISSSSSQFLSSFPGSLLPSSQLSERVPGNPDIVFSGALLPPLPPEMHRVSQFGSTAHGSVALTSKPAENGYVGLISSLMSKGLISLPTVTVPKESVGTEFNPDGLKVRHESVVDNLYTSLPRQCTTCGLRFKCQEEHSSHMDWHVTKNRILKNRKQKPSRKWFVSAKEWLSGAETVGTDAAPGFLPSEIVIERNEEREVAVPADTNQNLCALCGEPFEEFYSHDAEEWMYKGAVYLNAPEGHVEQSGRSQLGPIVHAKCQSKSSNK